MPEMIPSYLIQRLKSPYPARSDGTRLENPFEFGGGYVRGGLSKKAYDLLGNLWSWDYMGAAEFEFGAVPKALQRIAEQRDDLAAFEISVDYRHDSWTTKSERTGSAPVWVLCRADHRPEVERRIRHHACHDYSNKPEFCTKEAVGLAESLAGEDRSPIGWLELDNGFLFFSRREPWEGFCRLIGVEVPE